MKNAKKALASLTIAGMALTIVPFNAFATGIVPTRLAGTTAAQTAVAIADQTGWTGIAILASSASYGMSDALTAGPLSSYLKAPILLTGAGNVLDAATKTELVKLAVTKVYVTSGTAVISQAVLDELAGMNITVISLGGADRAATSVNIASKMVGVTRVAIANGLQDALSIAAIASAANEPILLTEKDALPASVKTYLAANPGITASDVIGGTGIISDAVQATLPSATRHAGNTAYDTNNKVIQDFASSLEFSQVYLANGATGIDALSGAPLAAQTKSAIVLTDGTVPAAATFVNTKLTLNSVITALGGSAVVPESLRLGVGYKDPTTSSATGYVYNTELQIDLKVRSTPNLDDTIPIKGYLYNYEKVKILDTIVDTLDNVVWDKISYNGSVAYVSNAYIQTYTSPPDNVTTVARNITKQFEVGTSNQIAGNADKEGLSLGYLQWCIGQGTLQPILNRMDRQYNTEMKSIFGTNYNSLHSMILDTPENQLKWANSINNSTNNIIDPWNSQFVSLCNNQDFINIEADAEVYSVRQAMLICDKYNIKTVRGFALAFDIVTQNGSISSDAAKIIDTALEKTRNMTEKNLLGVIANAVADSSANQSEDIRSRELAIVNGQGTVHGSILDLDTSYGLSDTSWR